MRSQENKGITLTFKDKFIDAYQVLIINLVRVTGLLFIRSGQACKLFLGSYRSLRRSWVITTWGMRGCSCLKRESLPLENVTFMTLEIHNHDCVLTEGSRIHSNQISISTRPHQMEENQHYKVKIWRVRLRIMNRVQQ